MIDSVNMMVGTEGTNDMATLNQLLAELTADEADMIAIRRQLASTA